MTHNEKSAGYARRIGQILCAFAVSAAAAVLLGWALEIETLKRVLPGLVAMNPVTAVAFILSGISLAVLQRETPRDLYVWMARGCAALVALIGLVKIVSLATQVDLGVDQWLFPARIEEERGWPNRMAPNTALNFLLIGLALLLFQWNERSTQRWARLFVGASAVSTALVLIGYLYGVKSFYGFASFIPMALHTAIGFALLIAGILCVRLGDETGEILSSRNSAGIMARRLLPAAIIVPVGLGWLRLHGEQAGFYETSFGVALFSITIACLLLLAIWWNAKMLHLADLQRSQAEAKLAELAAIVESSEDAILTKTFDGTIRSWNAGAEDLFGYSADEIIGKKVSVLFAPELHSEEDEIIKRIRRGERVEHYETVRVAKDGRHISISLSVSPIRDAAGQIVAASAIARDITVQKRAREAVQESEQRLQAIMDNTTLVIFVKDLEGRYQLINRQFERLIGRGKDEVLGKRSHDLFPPEIADMFEAQDRQALEAATAVDFEETVTLNGIECTYLSTRFALRNSAGVAYAMCGISTDITERTRGEKALQQAKNEADRANQAKSEFLSRMSHELRTPLNAILGFAQLLELDELEDDQSNAVAQILKGGRHLLNLINEVLDIARIESGALAFSPEPVKVDALIDEALALVKPLASQRGIRVSTHAAAPFDCYVRADRQRLLQVLLNLLANAVKFNRPAGEVVLSCNSTTDDRLRIEIADTGPGIPAAKGERLFTPFDRLGAEQSGIEGSGLGLALSRRLVEMMGGNIGVESAEGNGSTFWVELAKAENPLANADLSETEEMNALVVPCVGEQKKVLYIEDNLSNLELIERILRRRPAVKLLTAMQGRLGLELARQHLPDLILADLNLPDINGFEVLSALRDEPATVHIPVVIVSADATESQKQRLLKAGAFDYLTKPVNVSGFLNLLDEILGHKAGEAVVAAGV